ncbi:hypothetical protein [Bacillus methanolicus]|uniref:BppU N-terminal domain-containing protein n=1 Tax=Bacillus methanolicus (strain MGA3 / ATCC 53907) TaxID=796606 RepID=I3DTI9_BACMM|nr:hypothetical protein [Bacillus methanolicus]AIE61714.1 hypothetical protein BMMGA3_16825 [Bacillus methanolicus MGA3]EIJ77560.1 hypothetical protein MGA3_17722 [Bacillus methanolicus MGA3]
MLDKSASAFASHPSTLYDISLDFSEPLFIYKDPTGRVGFNGTWVVTTISVQPGSLGQKTSADKNNLLTYSITTDGTMGTITEKINGTVINTRSNPSSGQQFTVSLNQSQWDAIKFGNAQTLTIEMNGFVWTYTFDKRLNANDDILSAVKGVQDLQTHLNGIKAQLGAAIRSKGGTVNDTDAWSAFVSAVTNMQVKRWVRGTGTTSSTSLGFYHPDGNFYNLCYLTVTGLTFKPSMVLIWGRDNNYYTVLFPETIYSSYSIGRIITGTYNVNSYSGYSIYTFRLDSPAYVTSTGFQLSIGTSGNQSVIWFAVE